MHKIGEFRGEYSWLSNFWPCTVIYGGLNFPSAENAYQAAKEPDPILRQTYIFLTPGEAKKLGRKAILRPDWDQVKVKIMTEIVREKFTRHLGLKELLLSTGDAELVEGNDWNDKFWGVCNKTGVGENNLGKILMKIRSELKAKHGATGGLQQQST